MVCGMSMPTITPPMWLPHWRWACPPLHHRYGYHTEDEHAHHYTTDVVTALKMSMPTITPPMWLPHWRWCVIKHHPLVRCKTTSIDCDRSLCMCLFQWSVMCSMRFTPCWFTIEKIMNIYSVIADCFLSCWHFVSGEVNLVVLENGWVSDWFLPPPQQYFRYIMARTS